MIIIIITLKQDYAKSTLFCSLTSICAHPEKFLSEVFEDSSARDSLTDILPVSEILQILVYNFR